jgi:Family of unknown function (DUF6387)
MKRRIKSVEDIPAWFNLKKYQPLDKLDAAGWFYQFSLRADSREDAYHLASPAFYVQHHELEHAYSPSKSDNEPLRTPTNSKGYWESIDLLPLIQEDPILSPARLAAIDGYKRWMLTRSFAEIDGPNQTSAKGVHAATVEEFYMNELTVVLKVRQAARKFFDDTSTVLAGFMDEHMPGTIASSRIYNFLYRKAKARLSGSSDLDYMGRPYNSRYKAWLSEPLQSYQSAQYPKNHSLMSVNLSLPDSLLIEQFEDSLATLRRMSAIDSPTRLVRPDFGSWIKHGVLPYLDLSLWAFKMNVTISHRVMADAIFSAGFGSEEMVRKTTSIIADSMTSTSHRDFLNLKGQASQKGESVEWFTKTGA